MSTRFGLFLQGCLAMGVVLLWGCPNSTSPGGADPGPTQGTSVAVTGVTLAAKVMDLYVGGPSKALTAKVLPANATDQTLTWKSSAPAVASVSPLGVVKPLTEGVTIVSAWASDGTHSDSCEVTVTPAALVPGQVSVGVRFLWVVPIAEAMTTVTFTAQKDLLARIVVAEPGAYWFRWADQGQGKAGSGIDVTATLYGADGMTPVGTFQGVDSAFTTPVQATLAAGTYYLNLATKDGLAGTGTVDLQVWQPSGTAATAFDRLVLGPGWSTAVFSDQASRILALDVVTSGDYGFQWSDAGQGDGSDTVDVKLTLFDSTRSGTQAPLVAADSGYRVPVTVALTPGRYFLTLDSVSGTKVTGTCRVRAALLDGTALDPSFFPRLTPGAGFQRVTFAGQAWVDLAFDADRTGTWVIRWSDAGQGDGTDSLDVAVSVLDGLRSTVLGGIGDRDAGYLAPPQVSLDPGTYFLRLRAKAGGVATGTAQVRIDWLGTPGDLGVRFVGRLIVAPELTPVTWADETEKWFAVTVAEPGSYRLRWSDAASGDGTATVDVLVSALFEDGVTVFPVCDRVDAGYLAPVSLGALVPGTYYVKVQTKSGSPATGTMAIQFSAEK